MADASRSQNSPPDWSGLFAALPLEAPTSSAWPAIVAQLDRKKKRARNRTWLALAASLFALTALPVAWMLQDSSRDAGRDAGRNSGRDTGPVATSPDTIARATTGKTSPAIIDPLIATVGADRSAQTLSIPANTPRTVHAANVTRSADRARRRTQQAGSTATNLTPSQADAGTSLEPLYVASTQLETLLSFARDTRAESGPAAALASAFDAELATIDAQLAQPGLAAQQQQALWQARVDTLQQATGFEANQRLLSAEGRRYDGALVSVD